MATAAMASLSPAEPGMEGQPTDGRNRQQSMPSSVHVEQLPVLSTSASEHGNSLNIGAQVATCLVPACIIYFGCKVL